MKLSSLVLNFRCNHRTTQTPSNILEIHPIPDDVSPAVAAAATPLNHPQIAEAREVLLGPGSREMEDIEASMWLPEEREKKKKRHHSVVQVEYDAADEEVVFSERRFMQCIYLLSPK